MPDETSDGFDPELLALVAKAGPFNPSMAKPWTAKEWKDAIERTKSAEWAKRGVRYQRGDYNRYLNRRPFFDDTDVNSTYRYLYDVERGMEKKLEQSGPDKTGSRVTRPENINMSDETSDEQQFSDYLADLLEHHAGQVSDVQVEPRGTDLNIQRAQQADSLVPIIRQLLPSLQNLKDVGSQAISPPHTPEQAGQNLESLGAVAPFVPGVPTMAGKGLEGLGGLIKKVMSNPKTLKTILGSIGALAGTTVPAMAQGPQAPGKMQPMKTAPMQEPPPVEATKDEYERMKDQLRKDMEDARERIRKVQQDPHMMEQGPGSYDRKTGVRTYGEKKINQTAVDAATRDDRKLIIDKQQALDDMIEAEKPFTEKHQWFIPGAALVALGLGHGLSNMMTKSYVRKFGEIPGFLDRWLQVAETGSLGILDAFGATALPYQQDLKSVGRARREARNKTGEDLMREFGTEAGIDFTMAAIGGKTGLMQGGRDKNILKSPAFLARTGATSDIVNQVNQITDLQRTFAPRTLPAPAAAAPPVAAAAPAKPPRPEWSVKRQRWYNAAEPGNPNLEGWENVPPPGVTAATPKPKARRTIPTETVVPSEGGQSLPTLLRNLGTKAGPEGGGFMGGPEK